MTLLVRNWPYWSLVAATLERLNFPWRVDKVPMGKLIKGEVLVAQKQNAEISSYLTGRHLNA